MPEKESKIIFLTNDYEKHPAMRTDGEMKDCKAEEWPESFKEKFEKLKKAIGNCYIAPNPLVLAASEAAFENDKIRWSVGDDVYNEAMHLCQTTKHDFETCLEICQGRKADKLRFLESKTLAEKLEELDEEQRKLEEDIDNQPVINIVPKTRKSKEGKLPRKFREGG